MAEVKWAERIRGVVAAQLDEVAHELGELADLGADVAEDGALLGLREVVSLQVQGE